MSNINKNGVTYFNNNLPDGIQPYNGDTNNDNCGLTADQIDANFNFLRGNDVYEVRYDREQNKLRIIKNNGEDIPTDGLEEYIIHVLQLISTGDIDKIVDGDGDFTSGETGCISDPIQEIFSYIAADVEENHNKINDLSAFTTNVINIISSRVDRNEDDIRGLSGATANNSNRISEVEKTTSSLSEKVDKMSGVTSDKLDEVSKKANDNEKDIYNLKGQVAKNTDDIKNYLESYNPNEDDIRDLSGATASVFQAITIDGNDLD